MIQARSEGAAAAAKEWREEKRAMQLHIQQLQGVIAEMQDDKAPVRSQPLLTNASLPAVLESLSPLLLAI